MNNEPQKPERSEAAVTNLTKASTQTPNRNATGPRTPQGKERSKHNATKHGIFSSVVVSKEEKPEYESFLHGLLESFRTEGAFEEMLVDKLAILVWRLRKLLIAERAEFQKNDFVVTDVLLGDALSISRARDLLIRYEAGLNRDFDRTLALERVQRTRQGQPVAPRIDVNVSHD